ncbi:hypothetical protein [Microcoleus sp. D2_18a_D3]|uniref:hypothetical protein n=1 Tax=Microcoleus sp. D2_18a_D3 TaxID=3055330 RepID=UPI002FD0EAB8
MATAGFPDEWRWTLAVIGAFVLRGLIKQYRTQRWQLGWQPQSYLFFSLPPLEQIRL